MEENNLLLARTLSCMTRFSIQKNKKNKKNTHTQKTCVCEKKSFLFFLNPDSAHTRERQKKTMRFHTTRTQNMTAATATILREEQF